MRWWSFPVVCAVATVSRADPDSAHTGSRGGALQVSASSNDSTDDPILNERGRMHVTLEHGPHGDAVVEREDPAGPAAPDDPFHDVVLVGTEASFWCSGVLLDDRHVFTAAHCAAATKVGFGDDAHHAVSVAVVARRVHPTEDAAMLTLALPSHVRRHARRDHADKAPPLGTVSILGFGVRDPLVPGSFGIRHEFRIEIDGWGCTVARTVASGCRPDTELLIRGGRGNDTCLGDSGGPVFEASDRGWRLIAITSRGTRPRRVICGEGGIYVRVDAIGDWISEVTR
jgi:hypothetical protein